MGLLGEGIAENLSDVIGFSIVWVLPFLVVFGAIWFGYHLTGSRTSSGAVRDISQITLDEAAKSKITDLMVSVNELDDKMNRFFNEALHDEDRVVKYQSLLDSPEFSDLWDKYSSQRAAIIVISPELEDRVRLLLSLLQGCHKNTLSKQHTDQLPELSRQLDEQVRAIENIRKSIKQTIEGLIK